jgi:hypothetical protein
MCVSPDGTRRGLTGGEERIVLLAATARRNERSWRAGSWPGIPVDRGRAEMHRSADCGAVRSIASVPEPRTASVSISSNFVSTLALLLGSNVWPSVVSISSRSPGGPPCQGRGSATLSWRSPARPARPALLVTRGRRSVSRPSSASSARRALRASACAGHVVGSEPVHGSRSVAAARTLHERLHTHRTLGTEQVVLNEKPRITGAFAEPSDGLEPSTPSLPSRFRGNGSQPMATDLA